MKKITNELIQKYKDYLYEEEKAKATIEKYIHDVIAFMTWLCGRCVGKAVVMEYKNELIAKKDCKSIFCVYFAYIKQHFR